MCGVLGNGKNGVVLWNIEKKKDGALSLRCGFFSFCSQSGEGEAGRQCFCVCVCVCLCVCVCQKDTKHIHVCDVQTP